MEKPILAQPTPWTTIIVTCRKCCKKLDGGFGPNGRDSLRSALNDELRSRGRRRLVRVLEGKCFGLCPKRAAVALNASQPGQLLTISRGTNAVHVLEEIGALPRAGGA